MAEIAWVDGVVSPLLEARVSCLDRGFLFGDGVYEVVRVYKGKPFALGLHLSRLFTSMEAVRIKEPMKLTALEELVHSLLVQSGIEECQIYIQVTRGTAPRQHAFPTVKPSLIMFVTKLEGEIERDKGVKGITVNDDRWAHCHIKSVNLLPNILAKEEAKLKDAAEAIFVRQGGLVSEGSSSNVFVVKDGIIITPPADGRILAGITRGYFLKLARELGYRVLEQELPVESLRQADEVFVTSTIAEFLPIVELDGKVVGTGKPGPVGSELYRVYKNLCGR